MTVMTVATEVSYQSLSNYILCISFDWRCFLQAGYDFICFPLVHPRFKILDPAVSQIDKVWNYESLHLYL